MNLILGFGKNEEDFEEGERKFVDEFLREKMKGLTEMDKIFSDDIVAELKETLKLRAEEYKRLDKSYKDAIDYPERYSTYSFNILNDVCEMAIIFRFIHTNRRHPMSPDGWACIREKKVFAFYYDDYY